MLINFIKIAIRNILRQKLYSILNILGLSTGITASMFLFLYVWDEYSYDKMFRHWDRIYRVNTYASINDTEVDAAVTMWPLGMVLKEDYPEVLNFVRLSRLSRHLVKKDDRQFYEEDFFETDSTFFELFNFKMLSGDPEKALMTPNSIVLSESVAKKYFGKEDPMGQTIRAGKDLELRTVTGVMQDPYSNAHIKPRAVLPYIRTDISMLERWANIDHHLYILLPEGFDPAVFERKLPYVFEKYLSEAYSNFNAYARFSLTPLADIHLRSKLEGELEPGGSVQANYAFLLIAIFILVIASINYMNLATAKGAMRAKEVGVRKVMGSYITYIRWQFVIESMIITSFSALLSILFIAVFLTSFDEMAGKAFPYSVLNNPIALSVFVLIILFIGTLSGSYPAFYLSKFEPVEVLKGRRFSTHGNIRLRRVLVIFQFTISLVMITYTWVIYSQIQYINEKDLGFNQDQLLKVELNEDNVRQKYTVWRTKLLENPAIVAVGSGSSSPGGNDFRMSGQSVEDPSGEFINKVLATIEADQYYFETLEIPVLEGRNFNEHVGQDTAQSVIVNETLVRNMGWDNPIGKRFRIFANLDLDTEDLNVVGVVGDYHLRALREPIEPIVFYMDLDNDRVLIRMKTGNVTETLQYITDTWHEVVADQPIQYSFVSQDFAEQYQEAKRRGRIFAFFSGLTIFIACMGLFGLSSFNAELRQKEIGIRKVIGATLGDILILMSKDFLRLIIISTVIAFPVAWLYIGNWLEGYSYRIELDATTFLGSALLTILITLLTIGYHSVRAALVNPAVSLKDE